MLFLLLFKLQNNFPYSHQLSDPMEPDYKRHYELVCTYYRS